MDFTMEQERARYNDKNVTLLLHRNCANIYRITGVLQRKVFLLRSPNTIKKRLIPLRLPMKFYCAVKQSSHGILLLSLIPKSLRIGVI